MAKGKIEYKPNGAEFVMDADEYSKLQSKGTVIQTTGILNLEIGQKTGPWVVKEVDPEYVANKKYGATVRVTAAIGMRSMIMPIASSFVEKFKAAGLGVGDTFLLERTADYSANGKDGLEGYILTVVNAKASKSKKE